jgi:hypothetical protein
MRNACKILARKPEGKRLLGRLRWEDNIRMGLRETGLEVVGWIRGCISLISRKSLIQ